MANTTQEKFKPVAFNPKQTAAQRRATDSAFQKAYDALEDEFAALAELLKARREAGLTQAEVAQRMGVSQPVLARIESSLGSRSHAPSLSTLRRYAQACGKRLVISLV
jgi:DNA-binding XRE family transcriptional regulator